MFPFYVGIESQNATASVGTHSNLSKDAKAPESQKE
jgi:hypothetical protein